jgi:hypothetical protein
MALDLGIIYAKSKTNDTDSTIAQGGSSTVAGGGKKPPSDGEDDNWMPSDKPSVTRQEATEIAKENGYTKVGKTKNGEQIFYNKKGNPPYIVRSNSQHTRGEIYKGFNTEKQAEIAGTGKNSRTGTYDSKLNRVGN